MKTRILSLIATVFLAASSMVGHGTVQMNFFNVEEEGNTIVISWEVREEVDVREYELQRMTRLSNNRFVPVESIAPHGPNKPYVFRDDQVFKSSSDLVDYRLEVIYKDGVRELLARDQVNYTSTAIRRTWGSIKAMFQ